MKVHPVNIAVAFIQMRRLAHVIQFKLNNIPLPQVLEHLQVALHQLLGHRCSRIPVVMPEAYPEMIRTPGLRIRILVRIYGFVVNIISQCNCTAAAHADYEYC